MSATLLASWASLPSYCWTSRGRMRGEGATCTAPTTYGRPERMRAPEYGKIGAARTQRRRLSVRTAPLASQRPIARGICRESDGVGRVAAGLGIATRRARLKRVSPWARRPAGPDHPPGDQRCGFRGEYRGSQARDRTVLMPGNVDAGPSSWHAGTAIGRLTPRPRGAADAASG